MCDYDDDDDDDDDNHNDNDNDMIKMIIMIMILWVKSSSARHQQNTPKLVPHGLEGCWCPGDAKAFQYPMIHIIIWSPKFNSKIW